ncbi:MAG: hypothetical protein GY835_00805 [bacterium]|nr:hypothetical protein [bacterium]
MNAKYYVRILGSLLALLLLLGVMTPDAAFAKKNRFDKLVENAPELRDFQIPDVTRMEMANGMIVYLVEDHDLPLVNISVMIRTGSMYDNPGKVGLADMVGTVMRTGGTSAYPGDELDILLENLGAGVETGMNATSGNANLNCLTENFDQILPIFTDILRRPAFPQEKIDLAKTQSKTGISRRNDDPDGIARREIAKLYYGADSPYVRTEEYDTINAIEAADLVAFHEYYYHPDNMIMVVGGDFDIATMYAKLEAAFGDWPRGDTFFLADPVLEETEPSVNYIYKDDVNQSNVRMGHLGIKWDDQYVFPLQVLNSILGGGMSSRLVTEVRTKNELAYSAYAVMVVGNHHRMPFVVGTDTKSETTVKAIEIILRELKKVRVEEVTSDELRDAKSALKNAFVFNFSSPYTIARRKAQYEFWGRDTDYLDTYLEKVDAVTKADILAAAQARIHPDQMALLVVGRQEDFDKPLSSLGLGEPNEIDITIPEPSFVEEVIPAATEASLSEGLSQMEAALTAHGGARNLGKIKSLQIASDLTIQETPMGPMTFSLISRYRDGEYMRVDTNTPFGSMVQIMTPTQGWAQSPMGNEEMSASDLADAWKSERTDLLNVFRNIATYRCQALGIQELNGKECDVVHVTDDTDLKIKVFIATDTHRVYAMEYKDRGQMGPVLNLTVIGEFKAVSGFQFARNKQIHHDGTLFAELKVSDVQVNPQLNDDLFTAPE